MLSSEFFESINEKILFDILTDSLEARINITETASSLGITSIISGTSAFSHIEA